jgi:hypothetical protein
MINLWVVVDETGEWRGESINGVFLLLQNISVRTDALVRLNHVMKRTSRELQSAHEQYPPKLSTVSFITSQKTLRS